MSSVLEGRISWRPAADVSGSFRTPRTATRKRSEEFHTPWISGIIDAEWPVVDHTDSEQRTGSLGLRSSFLLSLLHKRQCCSPADQVRQHSKTAHLLIIFFFLMYTYG